MSAKNVPVPPDQRDDVDNFIAQRAKESPDVDTEGMAIFGRIHRIATSLAPHMEALFARFGLERGEFDALATLQRSGPPYRLSPTALYKSLMVSSGGLTYRLKRLEAAGMVRRLPSADDGRSLMVELTDEGLGTIRAAFEADMQLESRWLAALSGEERRELAGLLRKLGSAVPTFEKSDGGAGSSPVPIS